MESNLLIGVVGLMVLLLYLVMVCDPTGVTKTFVKPMSCCCRDLGCMGEDGRKHFPRREGLAFVSITAGSCPQMMTSTVTGIAVWGDGVTPPVDPTCADLAADCEAVKRFCAGSFTWKIPHGTWPDCGPYLASVTITCQEIMIPTGSTPSGCPNLTYAKCYFSGLAQVNRTFLAKIAKLCPSLAFDEGTGLPIYRHAVQTCCDYTDPACFACQDCPTPGTPCADVCDPTCHHCLICHDRCETLIDCCGSTGCSFHDPESEITDGYYENFNGTVGMTDPPILNKDTCLAYCGPTNYPAYRRYSFKLRSCQFPDDITGCNSSTCPPDEDKYGSFFIGFNYCGNDKLYFFCAGNQEEMAMHLSGQRIFKPCRHYKKHRPTCELCAQHKHNPAFREAIDLLVRKGGGAVYTPSKAVSTQKGIGSELAKLYLALGAGKKGCMECEAIEREMNDIGEEGVLANLDLFVAKLKARAKADATRWQVIGAGLNSIKMPTLVVRVTRYGVWKGLIYKAIANARATKEVEDEQV